MCLYRLSLVLTILIIGGCASVARVSDFPIGSESVDFESIPFGVKRGGGNVMHYNKSTEFKQYVGLIAGADIHRTLENSLRETGYHIELSSKPGQSMIAKRSMTMMEWSSVAGVYYKYSEVKNKYIVYIKVDVTQDITGSLRGNNAKKIMASVCRKNNVNCGLSR